MVSCSCCDVVRVSCGLKLIFKFWWLFFRLLMINICWHWVTSPLKVLAALLSVTLYFLHLARVWTTCPEWLLDSATHCAVYIYDIRWLGGVTVRASDLQSGNGQNAPWTKCPPDKMSPGQNAPRTKCPPYWDKMPPAWVGFYNKYVCSVFLVMSFLCGHEQKDYVYTSL